MQQRRALFLALVLGMVPLVAEANMDIPGPMIIYGSYFLMDFR
jgi:hypothetical protein